MSNKKNEPLNKLFAALVNEKSIDSKQRTADFVITTDGVDRDGDIMDPMGMNTEHYEKNPTVLLFHNYHSFPVGKVIKIKKTKKNVVATIEFVPENVLPEADTSWKLVELGFLKTVSIGFLPNYDTIERPSNMKKDGQEVYRIIKDYELMELSLVPVPSNRDAVAIKEAVKAGKLSKEVMSFLNGADAKETVSEVAELKAKIDELEAQIEETKMLEGEDDFFKALLSEEKTSGSIIDDLVDGKDATGNDILDDLIEDSGSAGHTESQIDNDDLLGNLI